MDRIPILQQDASAEILDVERAVGQRYSSASQAVQADLCCPTDYDGRYLSVLPSELIERDYGCGDPTPYLSAGETVLDLGSGGGKVCYIASQIVGASGQVLGVDMNDDMLQLARRFRQQIGDRLGYHNIKFFKGRIQDLQLDIERFDEHLAKHPVTSAEDWLQAQTMADRLRQEQPMIGTDSVDVIISNCVLNLVDLGDRAQMFQEMYRVLRRGGRVVISDIVCDEPVPARLRNDPRLWSGCISGAFVEQELLSAFQEAGFYGVEILRRQEDAWATVEGIEFRSVTVRAFKGKDGSCMDHHQAVIYKGPWKSVTDDDGHTLQRGMRTAVCEKTFQIYTRAPYDQDILPVPPYHPVAPEQAKPIACGPAAPRHPRETKGESFRETQLPTGNCCGPEECC